MASRIVLTVSIITAPEAALDINTVTNSRFRPSAGPRTTGGPLGLTPISTAPSRWRARRDASPAILANLAELAAKESMSVLEYLGIFRCRLFRALEATSAANDVIGVNRTVQTLLQVMDRIGNLTGEIARAPGLLTANVNSGNQMLVQMTDPLVAKLQSGLLRCLAKHPAARADVIAMLSELEAAEYRRHR
jgi:hypothetical protein